MSSKYFNTQNDTTPDPSISDKSLNQGDKPNILLDLDNTLIFSEYMSKFPIDDKKIRSKAVKFEFHDMDGYYIVFERPHVQEFLDRLFDNYNVSVWTAASKDYATFIIKNVILTKPGRCLDYVFWSYHVDLSSDTFGGLKNLQMLWDLFKLPGYRPDNTIIIDDHNEVYETQPDHTIKIRVFQFSDDHSTSDDELMKQYYILPDRFKKLKSFIQ
jgi:TFIIF-interacting CTD phosphatase-like protein